MKAGCWTRTILLYFLPYLEALEKNRFFLFFFLIFSKTFISYMFLLNKLFLQFYSFLNEKIKSSENCKKDYSIFIAGKFRKKYFFKIPSVNPKKTAQYRPLRIWEYRLLLVYVYSTFLSGFCTFLKCCG